MLLFTMNNLSYKEMDSVFLKSIPVILFNTA